MTDRKKSDDRALDQFFNAGKNHPPEPSAAFLARLSDDISANAPKERKQTQPIQSEPFGWFLRIFATVSLSGSAALGVWIGFLSPDLLTDPTLLLAPDTTIAFADFLPAANLSDTDGVPLP